MCGESSFLKACQTNPLKISSKNYFSSITKSSRVWSTGWLSITTVSGRKKEKKKKNNKRTQIIYRLAVAHGLKKKNYIETELRLLVHTNPFSTTDLHRLQVSNF